MSLLEHCAREKAAILASLQALADLASTIGMTTLAEEIRNTRVPKLQEERFYLVVLGEFNHGKSTFVNALLGKDVLPTGITPTTATINHVIHADPPRARAILLDGSDVLIAPGALPEWVTAQGGRAPDTRLVEVGVASELLRNQVTLVDTPGVNDLNDQRAEITYGYVPRADAVIFLLDAGQALKESERAFLATRVLKSSRERMIFVINKTDLLSASELEHVLAHVRKGLAPLVSDPTLFPVSARRHLAGDITTSGMGPLTDHLSRFLSTERGRILLDNAADDVLRGAAYLRQSLGVKRRSLDLSVAELGERVTRVRAQIEATQKSLAELHHRIQAERDAVNAQVRLDLEEFAARFEGALPAQIDAADASDIKRYLPLFIQDKFKEWAELEGEKVALLLERLAEEVIAVTNENTRTATAALASRLGPDTAIDLDVDSFKYDASIYAVGALGTTVFLFVNTLVGGLLTLSAPILAIVFQSKVQGEIKDQAKKQAPLAIGRAASTIAPHFASLVDDFAKRLSEFVTSAGDKLFRGIGEVLDRAMAERRAKGDEVSPLRASVDEQLAMLAEVEHDVAKARERLWTQPS